MYQLFEALKNRSAPPTDEELLFAVGKKVFDQEAASEYLKKFDNASKSAIQDLNEQRLKTAVSY